MLRRVASAACNVDQARLAPLYLASMFWALLSWALLAAVGLGSGCSEDLLEPGLDYFSFLQHSLEPRRAKETYSLFVKFHKVAGTTWRDFVDHITGVSLNCSNLCGKPYLECQIAYHTDPLFTKLCELDMDARHCDQPLHSCTFHQSLEVIRQAVSGRNRVGLVKRLAHCENSTTLSSCLAIYRAKQ